MACPPVHVFRQWQLPACVPCSEPRRMAFSAQLVRKHRSIGGSSLSGDSGLSRPDLLLAGYGRGEAGRDEKPPTSNSESGNAEAAPDTAQPPAEEPLAPQPTPVEPVPEVAGASKPVEETLQVCSDSV